MGEINEGNKNVMDQLNRGEIDPDNYIPQLMQLINFKNELIKTYHYYGNKNTRTMIENYIMEMKYINEKIKLLLGL